MVKKFLVFAALMIFGASTALSADTQTQFDNQWFKLTLPAGWEEIKIPNQPQVPGVNLMFANKEKNCFVSFAVAPGMNSAKAAADNAVAQMRKQKIKIQDPVEENGLYKVPVTRANTKGVAYFGSDGKDGAIVTMFGDAEPTFKELFANFKPVDPAMFPKF